PMSSRSRTSLFLMGASSTDIYTLSLHDALPIFPHRMTRSTGMRKLIKFCHELGASGVLGARAVHFVLVLSLDGRGPLAYAGLRQDRKSTRLNSSHVKISYAVFCLKKKNKSEYGW